MLPTVLTPIKPFEEFDNSALKDSMVNNTNQQENEKKQ